MRPTFIVGALVSTPYAFSNTAPITIRDLTDASGLPLPTPAVPYPSTIAVAGVPTPDLTSNDRHILLYKAVVTLTGLTHGFSPDIDALLVGPNGRAVKLISDSGFAPVSSVTLTFDDSAANFLPIEASPDSIVSGTYKPSNFGTDADAFGVTAVTGDSLCFITGCLPVQDVASPSNPNGDWRLYIIDDNPDPMVSLLVVESDDLGDSAGRLL
jgi:hypothetical protein